MKGRSICAFSFKLVLNQKKRCKKKKNANGEDWKVSTGARSGAGSHYPQTAAVHPACVKKGPERSERAKLVSARRHEQQQGLQAAVGAAKAARTRSRAATPPLTASAGMDALSIWSEEVYPPWAWGRIAAGAGTPGRQVVGAVAVLARENTGILHVKTLPIRPPDTQPAFEAGWVFSATREPVRGAWRARDGEGRHRREMGRELRDMRGREGRNVLYTMWTPTIPPAETNSQQIQPADVGFQTGGGVDVGIPPSASVIFHFADVRAFTVKRRGPGGYLVDVTLHRITFPPFSKDAVRSQRLQNYIMSPSFTFGSALRGKATPWLGPNPNKPAPMSCWECHGVDHYHNHCPIINSAGYRAVHGISDEATSSSVPTSLNIAPTPPTVNDWITVPFRGAYRGRGRGGRGGNRGGGSGNFRGAGRGYNGDHNRNYAPYSF
ncbi:hypothetical protein C8R43DRAFT_958902 [Mycena crocata]|nr:hypothetical protein C8R43DRAFT_958902 [Mycena crocata]